MIQLRFWIGNYPWSDTTPLGDKISVERRLGLKNNYHFCGVPLFAR